MHRSLQVARAAMAALLMASLAGMTSAQSPGTGPGAVALQGTDWNLVSTDVSGTQTPVPAGIRATLQIDGELAAGNSGCNRYLAPATVTDAGGLTFGDAATTLMACPEPQMTFEQLYLDALPTVTGYSISGTTLTLLNATGGAVLVYEAGPAATIEGSWVVTGYNNGNQGVETPPESVMLTAEFAPDGQVFGNGGCNGFSGPYSHTDTTIAIGPLMATQMSCGDATDAIESQYIAALQRAQVWSILNGTLELRDDGGALQASFVRA